MDKRIFQFILIGVILIAVIIYQFFFSKKAIVRRNIRKYPVTPISNFKEGERGRISGTVVYVDEPLKAPLSGRECSHYYVHIEQRYDQKNSRWRTLIEHEISSMLVLQNGGYYALIKRANLESYIVQDKEYRSGTFNDATPHLERYLKEHGHKSEDFFGFNKTLRYKEGVLEEGERVTVAGLGEWKQAEDIGLPAEYGKVLVMRCGSDTIYMSDDRDIVSV